MIEIGAAISGVKSLYDAARLAIDARDDAKLWCVSILLTPLLTAPGAPSRWDVFGICFWTFWGCMIFLRLLAGNSWPVGKKSD